MKKILSAIGQFALRAGLSSIFTASVAFSFAQVPTWDFESWTGTEPTGWISENEVMILGNPQSCFQESTPAFVKTGANSMKLVSVTMANPIAGLPNPIGLAAPGKLVSFVPKFGMQYTARPAAVNFWYLYTPSAPDTAEFLITLWNSTTGDTLGAGYWKTGATITTYTSKTVTITYNPAFMTQFPDSMALTFSSTRLFNPDTSMCLNCGKAGSILWVDDITFPGWNGINEHPASNGVILFPNPADDFVNISVDSDDAALAVAYDATGRMVASSPLSESIGLINKKAGVINVTDLASGLYSYSVLDKGGNLLRAGKFNVVR